MCLDLHPLFVLLASLLGSDVLQIADNRGVKTRGKVGSQAATSSPQIFNTSNSVHTAANSPASTRQSLHGFGLLVNTSLQAMWEEGIYSHLGLHNSIINSLSCCNRHSSAKCMTKQTKSQGKDLILIPMILIIFY